MKRNDLLTGETFVPSRITQKFASPLNRIKFNNDKANNLRHSLMFINGPLKTNLNILNALIIGKERAVFHKEFLRGKGFVFEVLTHFKTIQGKKLPCIYHYAINVIDDEKIEFINANRRSND
jgi:hypothetical protein